MSFPKNLDETMLCDDGLALVLMLRMSENHEESAAIWDTLTMHLVVCDRCYRDLQRMIH
jgi:hypothetical protein